MALMSAEKIIIGNWKSYKKGGEALEWFRAFEEGLRGKDITSKTVVICPPFTLLHLMNDLNRRWTYELYKQGIQIKIGAQDVSPFGEGKYTGEVNAEQLTEFVDWVIIGHSERRGALKETDDILIKKVEQAKAAGLKIVYCVENENVSIPEGVDVVAYEPPTAIGTGKPDTPENANLVAGLIKERNLYVQKVIYGGSVDPSNVVSFISQPNIDGVLPGGASLDPEKFLQLVLANPQ